MRTKPFLAQFSQPQHEAEQQLASYDARRGLMLDATGMPVILTDAFSETIKTITEVAREQTDEISPWPRP